MPRNWKPKETETEWRSKDTVSEAELLNRVVLAKALVAYCSGKSVRFKTPSEDIEITPRAAKDVMSEAGLFVKKLGPARP